MANITYLLGAGASYQACPILNNLSNAMGSVGSSQLSLSDGGINDLVGKINYSNFDELKNLKTDRQKTLWCLKYFGQKAMEYGTIDTYAKKLSLTGEINELNLLKMSVSVFFDLWENFYKEKFNSIKLKKSEKEDVLYENVDKRYISLLSIFLENQSNQVRLNDSVNFITWNYDLQLESAFKMFINNETFKGFEEMNKHFPFMRNDDLNLKNKVFHLNGHRGFLDYKDLKNEEKILEMRKKENFDNYWKLNIDLFESTINKNISFKNYIRYAWENQNFEGKWYSDLFDVIKETEVLIIIGYSFPLFNRKFDQELLSLLNSARLKEIVYQDPNANDELILNLFTSPHLFKEKIKLKKEISQFYIPHNHFISQFDEDFEVVIHNT